MEKKPVKAYSAQVLQRRLYAVVLLHDKSTTYRPRTELG